MPRLTQLAALAVLLSGAGAQLIQPDRQNPAVVAEHSIWNAGGVDSRVAGVLRRACADCHSNETQWPWYSRVSPISWFVARHVRDGRAKLNFSEWNGGSPDLTEEIYESVAKNKMPLPGYSIIHRGARLTPADREILRAWADGALAKSEATPKAGVDR